MTWLIENFKIQLEEQLLIKYCGIKHLILLKIQNMMDINVDLLQWPGNFLIKKLLVELLKDQQLGEELHKPIIKKFKRRKEHSPSINMTILACRSC